jgi:hypothetical protein
MADRRRADAERPGGLFKTTLAGDGVKARRAPSGGRRGVLMAEFFSSMAENYAFVCPCIVAIGYGHVKTMT